MLTYVVERSTGRERDRNSHRPSGVECVDDHLIDDRWAVVCDDRSIDIKDREVDSGAPPQ